jgi:hypothetical protein
MKPIYILLLLPLFLGSCAGGWQEEDKAKLRNECLSQSTQQIGEGKAKAYCDCFVDQVVAKYPVFNDFMEHMSLDTVESLKAHCRKVNGIQ